MDKFNQEDLINITDAINRLSDKIDIKYRNPSHVILTSNETSELLKISTKTLAKYRNEGLIGYSKIGREFFYRLSDILKMLDDHFISPF